MYPATVRPKLRSSVLKFAIHAFGLDTAIFQHQLSFHEDEHMKAIVQPVLITSSVPPTTDGDTDILSCDIISLMSNADF